MCSRLMLGIALLLCGSTPIFGGSPRFEVNIGYIPFNAYGSPSFVPASPNYFKQNNDTLYGNQCAGMSLRACMQLGLQRYRQAGFTGVRFFFGICGDAGSTAFVLITSRPCEGPRNQLILDPQWKRGVELFFDDLLAQGLAATPTPSLEAGSSIDIDQPYSDPCSQETFTGKRHFFASPLVTGKRFGETFPICWDHPNAWWLSPPNPYFIGWAKFYEPINFLVRAASGFREVGSPQSRISLTEFDLVNEINLVNLTSQYRFIYDGYIYEAGTYPAYPYSQVQGILYTFGYDYRRVTFSTIEEPTSYLPDLIQSSPPRYYQYAFCWSMYSDTARFIKQSALVHVLRGGPIGNPEMAGAVVGSSEQAGSGNGYPRGYFCGGSAYGSSALFRPGIFLNLPRVIDIHSYPSLGRRTISQPSNRDMLRAQASRSFDDILSHRGWSWSLDSDYAQNSEVVIGETHSVSGYRSSSSQSQLLKTSCENLTNEPGINEFGGFVNPTTPIQRWYAWATRDGLDQSWMPSSSVSPVIRPWGNPLSNDGPAGSACFAWPNDRRLKDAFITRPAQCPDDAPGCALFWPEQ